MKSLGPEKKKHKSGYRDREKELDERTHVIKDLDDDEGFILSHPKQRVVSILKHFAELPNVVLRVRIEFGEFLDHGHVRGSLLQKLDERPHRRSFLRFVSQ